MITEKVTKLDVARRQLDEAILMFYEKRDTVSIHALASGASQVLADLCKHRGIPAWTRSKDMVKPGRWKEWRAAVTKFEAFFKHADTDPNDTCDFHPEITPLFLIESVELLRLLTGRLSWAGYIFAVWFQLAYPEFILDGELKTFITKRASLVNFDPTNFSMLVDLLKMRTSLQLGVMENCLL